MKDSLKIDPVLLWTYVATLIIAVRLVLRLWLHPRHRGCQRAEACGVELRCSHSFCRSHHLRRVLSRPCCAEAGRTGTSEYGGILWWRWGSVSSIRYVEGQAYHAQVASRSFRMPCNVFSSVGVKGPQV